MQQLFGVASEGLYSLMTSRMRVPTDLPVGFGGQTAVTEVAAGAHGDARSVLVPLAPLVPLSPAEPVEYARGGVRHAA